MTRLTAAILALAALTVLTILHGTSDPQYQSWRPQLVCIDIGTGHPLCHTIQR